MKTIAVLFGGKSTEHDVSIITALTSVIRPLMSAGGYEIEPVYISKEGNWYWDQKLADVSIYRSGEIIEFMSLMSTQKSTTTAPRHPIMSVKFAYGPPKQGS